MPRPNRPRSVEGESNLALRIQREREYRKLSYEGLARLMTDTGCSMQGSAIYKIEKGNPPRRITVDELVAFAGVFDTDVQEMLTPVEVLRTERGKEIIKQIEEADEKLIDSVTALLNGYMQYFDLAIWEPDLQEYVDNHRFRSDLAKEAAAGMSFGHLDVDGRRVEIDSSVLRDAVVAFYIKIVQQAGDLTTQALEESARDRG